MNEKMIEEKEKKEIIRKITIQDVPTEFMGWKDLGGYSQDWSFLSGALRYNVAEQLASLDYLISLYKWLKPLSVYRRYHKRQIIAACASIYEGVLAEIFESLAENELASTKILRKQSKLEDNKRYLRRDRFVHLIEYACDTEFGFLDSNTWKTYLDNTREVRNWSHLTRFRSKELSRWIGEQGEDDIKVKLIEFKNLVKEYQRKIRR